MLASFDKLFLRPMPSIQSWMSCFSLHPIVIYPWIVLVSECTVCVQGMFSEGVDVSWTYPGFNFDREYLQSLQPNSYHGLSNIAFKELHQNALRLLLTHWNILKIQCLSQKNNYTRMPNQFKFDYYTWKWIRIKINTRTC